jgi:hypothetical protein
MKYGSIWKIATKWRWLIYLAHNVGIRILFRFSSVVSEYISQQFFSLFFIHLYRLRLFTYTRLRHLIYNVYTMG